MKERINRVYFRLNKNSCRFKEQARTHQAGEKYGLILRQHIIFNVTIEIV